jgi:hypothetical protein
MALPAGRLYEAERISKMEALQDEINDDSHGTTGN